MKDTPIPPAKTVLYCVSYVDAVVREAFVEARDENEAEALVDEEFSNGVHHHAVDAYREDMQAQPAVERSRHDCFECGH